MKGIETKRAVSTTLEKIWQASGREPADMTIIFAGKTAVLTHERYTGRDRKVKDRIKINMPAIDETGDIDVSLFSNLIGFSLHELAFAWFDPNLALQKAAGGDKSVYAYACALQDVRVEQELIESGYAGNARALLENLLNSTLAGQPALDNAYKQNVPAIISIEGKRGNGYTLTRPDTLSGSPWEEAIAKALKALSVAKTTETVLMIAQALYEDIGDIDQDDPPPPPPPRGKGKQEEGDGEGEEEGEEDGDGEDEAEEKSTPAGGKTGSKAHVKYDPKDALEKSVKKATKDLKITRLPARAKPVIHTFKFD
jgi:hypothetical protein